MTKLRIWQIMGVLAAALLISCTPATQDKATADSGTVKNSYIADGEYTGPYWPTTDWKTAKPETVGMDSAKLAEAIEYCATDRFNTEGLLVIKKGYIVGEGYFHNFRKDQWHVSNSMAKSFTSTLIGIAIDKGLISGVDEKLCQYYEDWDCEDADWDLRAKITIRHAMTLTSGLEWVENWSKVDPNTNDALKMGRSAYYYEYMSDRDGLHEPGKRFYYSTGDPMLLSRVIQEETGMSAFKFAKQHLFDPIGIKNVRWDEDRQGYTATAWGLYTTVREFGKFGFLILNKGKWDDKQIVSEAWVEKATKTDSSVKMWAAYGYLWHVNLPYRLSSRFSKSAMSSDVLPADSFMAEGVEGQNIFIFPSQDLVVVKVANQKKARIDEVKLLSMILDADKSSLK